MSNLANQKYVSGVVLYHVRTVHVELLKRRLCSKLLSFLLRCP